MDSVSLQGGELSARIIAQQVLGLLKSVRAVFGRPLTATDHAYIHASLLYARTMTESDVFNMEIYLAHPFPTVQNVEKVFQRAFDVAADAERATQAGEDDDESPSRARHARHFPSSSTQVKVGGELAEEFVGDGNVASPILGYGVRNKDKSDNTNLGDDGDQPDVVMSESEASAAAATPSKPKSKSVKIKVDKPAGSGFVADNFTFSSPNRLKVVVEQVKTPAPPPPTNPPTPSRPGASDLAMSPLTAVKQDKTNKRAHVPESPEVAYASAAATPSKKRRNFSARKSDHLPGPLSVDE